MSNAHTHFIVIYLQTLGVSEYSEYILIRYWVR